jgi:arylsulfatase A-like enzyme
VKPAGPATIQRLREGAAGANVIIILIDAASAKHFGVHGYHRDTTPNLDRFLTDSVLFEQAYTNASATKPPICSLFTGQFPDTHGNIDLDGSLPREAETLTEQLQRQGYATAAFSASPFVSKPFGLAQGFDHFTELSHRSARSPGQMARGSAAPNAEQLLEAAMPWFESHAEERLFAYLHFLEPHQLYNPPEPYLSKYDREETKASRETAAYDGNLAYVDDVVGQLLGHLDRLGLAENSIIVFLSDHGECLGEHDYYGHPDQVWQEIIHIPLGFRLPPACGVVPARRSNIVSIIDIMPTLLDLLGMELPAGMQGTSRLSQLLGEAGQEHGFAVTRSRKWDETDRGTRLEIVTYALSMPRHTLALGNLGQRVEVYDRDSDPGQLHDIAEERPQLRAELLGRFEEWAQTQRLRPVVLPGGDVSEGSSARVEMGDDVRRQLETLGYLK